MEQTNLQRFALRFKNPPQMEESAIILIQMKEKYSVWLQK